MSPRRSVSKFHSKLNNDTYYDNLDCIRGNHHCGSIGTTLENLRFAVKLFRRDLISDDIRNVLNIELEAKNSR